MTKLEAPTQAICPICGVRAKPKQAVPPTMYYGCSVCETHFQHPMPTIDQMHTYVQDEYANGVYQDYVSAANLKAATFSRRARLIAERSGPGALLDVGASCGFFVEQALAVGFDAYGVELSSEAVAKAPELIRRRLTIGDVNSLSIERSTPFDVITAFDLIEHVFDPIVFLQSLRTVAHPGTWIVITTPDVGHFLRPILRQRWPMYQPMQHTVLMSERGLKLALSRAGFDSIEIGPANKTLTADYLAGQVEMYLPGPVKAYRSAARVLPSSIRNAPININIGELMAFARVI